MTDSAIDLGAGCAASLPMYDFPEVRPHVDRLWEALRDAMGREGLRGMPRELTHLDDEWDVHWSSRTLCFSQICGADVVIRYAGTYRVLATPRFSAPGCVDHNYRSLVVVRDDSDYRELADLEGARLALNSYYSHSGSTSLVPLIAPLSTGGAYFADRTVSGSHEASLGLIRRGEVDVAAIDCVTFAMLARYRPEAVQGVRSIAQTPAAPAPPYVTPASYGRDVSERMRRALAQVFADPDLEDTRRALFLEGLELSDETSYEPIRSFAEEGERYGYAELRDGYRFPVRIPLSLRRSSASALAAGPLRLSRTGAFVPLAELPRADCSGATGAPPLGSRVNFELALDEPEAVFRAEGIVVSHDSAGDRPGIELRFAELSPEQQGVLETFLASAGAAEAAEGAAES